MIHIPPALVLGTNTPHGINVLSDFIEEQTGITPIFHESGWDNHCEEDNGYGPSFYQNNGNGYGNGFGYGYGDGYGRSHGDGRGEGCGYGCNNGKGTGYGCDGYGGLGHGGGNGYGRGDYKTNQ